MLAEKYNHKEIEKKWQEYWRDRSVYKWRNDLPREQTFVIDTPPPTVSGLLHMGHVFSYTQADFVARFWRMRGKDVFYPMGFDDNGLPTERLVEKVKNIRVGTPNAVSALGDSALAPQPSKGPRLLAREDFIAECKSVVDEAEQEFEAMFNSIALSVDWEQKYQTISPESQKISQASFVDLYKKDLIEKNYKPVIWDCVDQTALSQADLIDAKEACSKIYFNFIVSDLEISVSVGDKTIQEGRPESNFDGEKIKVMTTRPELLPACVALIINPQSDFGKKLNLAKDYEGATGHFATTPLFKVRVPIIADLGAKIDEGNNEVTGAVMCCTYGDENDIKWYEKYKDSCNLKERVIIADYDGFDWQKFCAIFGVRDLAADFKQLEHLNFLSDKEVQSLYFKEGSKSYKIKDVREKIIKYLEPKEIILEKKDGERNIKKAERSGAEAQYLPKIQWFIKTTKFKNDLIEKINSCSWNPDFMKVRAIQWCENLSSDWCISRQRFFGVPIPAWRVRENNNLDSEKLIVADFDELPLNPTKTAPKGFINYRKSEMFSGLNINYYEAEKDGKKYTIFPETDILDTWATSSVSPQLSSGAINEEMLRSLLSSGAIDQAEFDKKLQRHQKLFPANMRPQAHEIIRTWAFYTIVKAYLHNNFSTNSTAEIAQKNSAEKKDIPWENLMISGWCLAADKTKMSKSKGNVVTPTALIEEKSSDIVRYWASTSHLGADTAYSEDVFKIGQKLVTKLFNAAKFVAINFEVLENDAATQQNQASATSQNSAAKHAPSPAQLVANKTIFCAADLWILSRLHQTIAQATLSFEKFEYARAREKIEEFFWHDFCDNYLEIVKVRSYGLKAEKLSGRELTDAEKQEVVAKQLSGIHTLKICLSTLLKLFAPFIPHITEEIYAGIFAKESADFAAETQQETSIHSRGTWPKLEEFFFEEAVLNMGQAALEVIFEVRKFKSDNSLSMKTTVPKLTVQNPLDLTAILEDLGNVCNATKVDLSVKNQSASVAIEL